MTSATVLAGNSGWVSSTIDALSRWMTAASSLNGSMLAVEEERVGDDRRNDEYHGVPSGADFAALRGRRCLRPPPAILDDGGLTHALGRASRTRGASPHRRVRRAETARSSGSASTATRSAPARASRERRRRGEATARCLAFISPSTRGEEEVEAAERSWSGRRRGGQRPDTGTLWPFAYMHWM